jgi:hypothetical protein
MQVQRREGGVRGLAGEIRRAGRGVPGPDEGEGGGGTAHQRGEGVDIPAEQGGETNPKGVEGVPREEAGEETRQEM